MDHAPTLAALARLASLASFDLTSLVAKKRKPRAPCKTLTATTKKPFTPEEWNVQSMERREQRHAMERKLEEAKAATTQQEEINARVTTAMRHILIYIGLNPSQDRLTTIVDATSTGSSAFPRALLPESPRTSTAPAMVGFHHHYPHASRFSGECSPDAFS
ncbi:putative serine/threonine-protein kinase [Hordeum vulgare]|nr:putative serine/threonine-protein kinase [Hordeum vulgare]